MRRCVSTLVSARLVCRSRAGFKLDSLPSASGLLSRLNMANLRGHYIPSVANALLEASDAGTAVARPQGLAMGNAWVSPQACLGQYHLRNSVNVISY